jgi:N-acetyl-alpha-D-muramate 1-phosphate uridylyltransferase
MSDSLAGRGRQANSDEVVGVVLAAGEGRRLRPLTLRRPKALCPVGNEPLVDRAVRHVRTAASPVAVNIHHGRDLLEPHVAALGAHASLEDRPAMGTAGALGLLRSWIDGRDVLAVNADAWTTPDLAGFLDGWDGERVRLLVAGGAELVPGALIAATLLPAVVAAGLSPEPGHLYERSWLPAEAEGRLEVVPYDGPFVDCGTPSAYLRANLLAADQAGGSVIAATATAVGRVQRSVVGAEAVVEGEVVDSVVWDGARVEATERLVRGVRADNDRTVLVR